MARVSHTESRTALAAAGVYTSTFQRVTAHPRGGYGLEVALGNLAVATRPLAWEPATLIGLISTDQNGTLNIDFSLDGSTTHFTASQAVTGGTPMIFRISLLTCKYIRLRYVNGAVVQTTLELAAWLDGVDIGGEI